MKSEKLKIAIEALNERREELLNEIESLNKSIKLLGGTIDENDNTEIDNVEIDSGKTVDISYKPSWGLKNKFAYLLKKHNRFLHFREVAEMINSLEKNEYEIGKLAANLSASTQSLKSNGTIVKYKVGNNNRSTFWGYKDWLTKDNEIVQGHGYSQEYVYDPSKSKEDLFKELR